MNSRSRRGQRFSRSNSNLPALDTLNIQDNYSDVVSKNTEQEDHDLALAMQLQEEEEERERQESAKRKRDDELSQAYLDAADSQGRRTFPGFGRGAGASGAGASPQPRGRGSAMSKLQVVQPMFLHQSTHYVHTFCQPLVVTPHPDQALCPQEGQGNHRVRTWNMLLLMDLHREATCLGRQVLAQEEVVLVERMVWLGGGAVPQGRLSRWRVTRRIRTA